MGKSKSDRWQQIKTNAEKEEQKVKAAVDLDFDAIDTAEELRKIENMTHDPNDTRREMDVLTNTSTGAPVRLPSQLKDQEDNLGADDTLIEMQDHKLNTPKLP